MKLIFVSICYLNKQWLWELMQMDRDLQKTSVSTERKKQINNMFAKNVIDRMTL